MERALAATLAAAADLMRGARGDWWVIAGAAAALHGASDPAPTDVDLLVTPVDFEALVADGAVDRLARAPSDTFASSHFGRALNARLPIEVMSGFRVRDSAQWVPIAFNTRERRIVQGATLFVPSIGELRKLLTLLGRPKDLLRRDQLVD